MQDESIKKTIGIALAVSLVCSIMVSAASVSLRPIQEKNKRLERIKNILIAGDLFTDRAGIEDIYNEKIESTIIDLETGETVPDKEYNDLLNTEDFNIKRVARDEKYGKSIPPDQDIAQIKRMPRYMVVYMVKRDNRIDRVILPIYGKGLWSTMYGFIALDRDLKTIKGFTFYDQAETPGLGGEVDNPKWKQIWRDKKAFDDNWNLKIEVIKGRVDTSKGDAKYKIDGLSGATITTRGVNNLVRFWLGDRGYGPFLKRLREKVQHG